MLRVVLVLAVVSTVAHAKPAPMRPLPGVSKRPAATTPARYVAPAGSDTNDGSRNAPWKTIAHALGNAKPGDTVYLRGGTYYESLKLTRGGTAGAPLTLRSAPNELAIIDAGLPEFAMSSRNAWEPAGKDEYRSTKTYPSLATTAAVRVTGNFADTMIPLHGYRFVEDLRATSSFWTVQNAEAGNGVYLGPGVWFDPATKKIHARLSRLGLKSFEEYDGPTDPRTLPLVIATPRSALAITASHVRLQDLVLRGSSVATLELASASHVEIAGVTIYGGAPAIHAKSTTNLKIIDSAVRGSAAPWSSRPSMKYRGNAPYLLVVDSALPQSANWEITRSDFTDGHDGLVLDSIKKLRFHHNLVDNFNDDALYLTFVPRASIGDDIQIFENKISRVFTALSFADTSGNGKNPIGKGVFVFRNLFDLRLRPHRSIPRDADGDSNPRIAGSEGRLCGDHGSPIWDPIHFYQNTVITDGKPFRGYYGAVLVQNVAGSRRRIFNNIFVRMDGEPGLKFPSTTDDLEVDANLLWGVAAGERPNFFDKFRKSKEFLASQSRYPPGWGARDIYADPRFVNVAIGDVRLQRGSPAIDAGIAIPTSWPDSLRGIDRGKPDLGALPEGAPPPSVGAH